jgi:hypothetical protein
MGLALSFVPFLDECHRQSSFSSPMLGLGDIKFHEDVQRLVEFATKQRLSHFGKELSVRSFLKDRYGLEEYLDCDLHERADLKVDLAGRLDESMVSRFGAILNAGTLEHIFDQRTAFENVHRMLKPGGMIIHLAPVTWYEHAYYNFNPRLFRDIAAANRYTLIAEAFHERDESGCPRCTMTFEGGHANNNSSAYASLIHEAILPAYLLYMVAYKKPTLSESFKVPYDIAEVAPDVEEG